MFSFRLANIFQLTNFSNEKIWRSVKKVKLETSLDTICDRTGWYYDKLFQVAAVEEQLQIESSEERFAKISLEDMNAAAEMFIYLNTCPRSFKPWIEFYKYLFQTQSPKKIILSLNRIMKEALNQKDVFLKKLAHNLFKRMTSLLSLKYEEIQSLFPGTTKNISFTLDMSQQKQGK